MSSVTSARWLIPRQRGLSEAMRPGYGWQRRFGITPPRRSRGAPWSDQRGQRTVIHVLRRLLAPWRTASTWRMLVHAVLDLPLGMLCFVPTVALLGATLGLAVTLPLAIVPLTLVLAWTRLATTVERSRFE